MAIVEHVSSSPGHQVSKQPREAITVLEGLGVEGDAHSGETVRHRSRVRADPSQPNLRQVHLIHGELHDELAAAGLPVAPGQMGENITTRGIDLLALPRDSVLGVGASVRLRVTGLRNPCDQLDGIHPGLRAATVDRDADGRLIRKAGVMTVVLRGGTVLPGDAITVELPPGPHVPLDRV